MKRRERIVSGDSNPDDTGIVAAARRLFIAPAPAALRSQVRRGLAQHASRASMHHGPTVNRGHGGGAITVETKDEGRRRATRCITVKALQCRVQCAPKSVCRPPDVDATRSRWIRSAKVKVVFCACSVMWLRAITFACLYLQAAVSFPQPPLVFRAIFAAEGWKVFLRICRRWRLT